jgi:hypothetical protein
LFFVYRRRLPRPPPVGGSTDSPSGTLNSTSSSMLRTPTASNSSRTSRDISTANASMSQKMNTISTVGSSGGQSAKVHYWSYCNQKLRHYFLDYTIFININGKFWSYKTTSPKYLIIKLISILFVLGDKCPTATSRCRAFSWWISYYTLKTC